MEENRHLLQGLLFVRPECRRQGIGSRLLVEITHAGLSDGRRVFISEAADVTPGGLEFARAVGGDVGLPAHTNQLDLSVVDRMMLDRWIEQAQERAGDFELLFWDGAYPEELLAQIGTMKDAMNEAPIGELDLEDMTWTPDYLRQVDEMLEGRNIRRWTFVARHRPSGELAGFSEILWLPNKPLVGNQGDTGVLNRYRQLGLGRWLKAAMLQKVLAEKPQVRFIRTGNADANAAMLKINHELGFAPLFAFSVCQARLDQIAAYLRGKGLMEPG